MLYPDTNDGTAQNDGVNNNISGDSVFAGLDFSIANKDPLNIIEVKGILNDHLNNSYEIDFVFYL